MEKPKLLIVAGPNGSGKTSVTSKILKHKWIEGCEYINPDNIARDIFGDWNSVESVLKAARYAADMRENCIANGHSPVRTRQSIVHSKSKTGGLFHTLVFYRDG